MPIILISFFATLFAFTASPLHLLASVSWCFIAARYKKAPHDAFYLFIYSTLFSSVRCPISC